MERSRRLLPLRPACGTLASKLRNLGKRSWVSPDGTGHVLDLATPPQWNLRERAKSSFSEAPFVWFI